MPGEGDASGRTRRSCAIVGIAASAVASCCAAAGESGPVARFPFSREDGRVVLPVRIGGSRELRVTLDTGMAFPGVFLFHEELVEELALPGLVEVLVPGAGEGEGSRSVMADSVTVRIGDAEFGNQRVIVSRSRTTQGFPRDGVTGFTLLGSYEVEIRHEPQEIVLHAPGSYTPDSTWTAIDLDLREGIPWLEAAVSVEGEEETPVSVYIDLAAADPLVLLVRPGMKVPVPAGLEERYLGTGLGGDVTGRSGTVARLCLGPWVLRDLPTAFPAAEVRSRQAGADGILGGGLLQRFDVIFDYARARLFLKPNGPIEG